MNEGNPANDFSREEVVIFVAEGIVCERLDIPIHEAVVLLAEMAVNRGVGLVDLARQIVAGAVDPGPCIEAYRRAAEQTSDPGSH
jgi:hypothetical protein